ncbi:MAG: signal peptidase II [Clostridia bacterium]|nr:signal peptidase II [Clostridia bacterium]
MLLFFVITFLIPVLDQFIKLAVKSSIAENAKVETFLPFLTLTNVKNFGAALGMLANGRYILIAVTLLIMIYFLYLIFIKKIRSHLFLIASSLIVGGGIGNLIDRLMLGYVVDYLSLSFFSPICNFSDYSITAGVVLLAIFVLKADSKTLSEFI